ncbi:MAG TPA: hypothetical protein VIV11_13560 [Kofleriaceae bacterium]
MRSWWQARRRRRLFRRLTRSLDPASIDAADHKSAALLSVLTESIARITAGGASLRQVTASLELARRTYAEYEDWVARCRTLRDSADDEAATWRNNVVKAERAGSPELAVLAQQRVELWERRERDARAAITDCIAGLNRLADAITELQRLADRRQPGS